MGAPLQPLRIYAPGTAGLNSEEQHQPLEPQFSTVFLNGCFDTTNRAAARKGWEAITTSGSPGAYDIESMYCYEDGTNTVVISAANNAIYYGDATMTSITITPTIAANNWKFQTWVDGALNKYIIAWQAGEEPMISPVTGTTPGTFAAMQVAVTASGTGTVPDGNEVHVAHGRIWAVDSDGLNVIGCATLDYLNWSTGAFAFDTTAYWPGNAGDRITAIHAWEDKLVVFGENNILIYGNPHDTSNWYLADTIAGIGCIARDSVQAVGKDLMFLSRQGVRSLGRTIQNERTPLQIVGQQVRGELQNTMADYTGVVKSVYSPSEGFYLLIFQEAGSSKGYLYDLKGGRESMQAQDTPLNLGAVRMAVWTGWDATALASGADGTLYLGVRDGSNDGIIASYGGYLDGAETYQFTYASPWLDLSRLQPEMMPFIKLPKALNLTVAGGAGYTVNVGWGYDFEPGTSGSQSITIPPAGATSTWGVGFWGEALFSYDATLDIEKHHLHPNGQGNHIRLTVTTTINQYSFALQDILIYMKKGRLAR